MVYRTVHGGLLLAFSLLLGACGDDGGGSSEGETENADATGGGEGGDDGGTSGGDGGGTSGADESGAGEGESGGGEAGGGDTAGLDEVEEACEADCEAQFATECAPTLNQNVLTCKLSCAAQTVQLEDFCLSEYTSVVQCRADGGYDCINGFPTPRATCAAEQATFGECMADLGCKRTCDDGIDEGCISGSFDDCLSGCIAEQELLPEFCRIYSDQFSLCRAQQGGVCEVPDTEFEDPCIYSLVRTGECIADDTDDLCAGYCFVDDELGCSADCAADCQSRLADATCATQFQSLAECALRHGDFVCTDGRLAGIDICDTEEASYQACLAG